jgi:hypothetical protein
MIRMKLGGTFKAANDEVDHETEFTDILQFSMRLPFSGALFRNQCGALEIELVRVAETKEPYELLATKYLFGTLGNEAGHGQALVAPAEVIIINPNSAKKEEIQGKFTIEKAQVVDVSLSDDDAGAPKEIIRLVCTGVKYKGTDAAQTEQAFLVPNF